jgi:hypothetical protein
MRQQISRELYSYWNVMRGARAAPERTRLDPGAIRPILADTFLLEVDSDGEFPFRVAGARVNALWRRELKETSFIDLWRKEDRHSVQAALRSSMASRRSSAAPACGRPATAGSISNSCFFRCAISEKRIRACWARCRPPGPSNGLVR